MKVKKLLAFLAAAALACCALCATGCSANELHVALHPGYVPFDVMDEDGNYSGIDYELAQQLADDMGKELVIENMDFDAIIPAVKAGTKVDLGISGISITDERAEIINFSDPYYTDNQSIAVKDTQKWTKDNYKEGLNQEGITIYVQSGTSSESYAKENFPKATITPIAQVESVYMALSSGQCDAIVANSAPCESYVNDTYTDLTIIDTVATSETYGIAVSKDNEELLAQVNELLAKYNENGFLKSLLVKYNA